MTNEETPADLDTAISYYESHAVTPAIGAAAAFMNLATVKATLGFLKELKQRRAVEPKPRLVEGYCCCPLQGKPHERTPQCDI